MKPKSIITLLLTVIIMISFAFKVNQAKKPWPVPDAAKGKKSPIAGNAQAKAIADGKVLWGTHCKSCHGAKGLGDGNKAAQLKTEPGDFSKADFQAQSDGALFFKISEGREDMPSFKKKIPDTDELWSIVAFARTLKK